MQNHLIKACQALWTLALGGFLGLTGGLIVAIIVIFRGAEQIAASPGVEPYRDPMFSAFQHQAVAGYTGQLLFKVGGIAALVLLALAVVSHITLGLMKRIWPPTSNRSRVDTLRTLALIMAVVFMLSGTAVTLKINASWPGLYDTSADSDTLTQRRADFDQLHQWSERVVTIAWLCGALALCVSPWCKEPASSAVVTTDSQ
ncbi:MAG: hypothetical protein ACIAXF_08365 [Phycisphaerales bacterium JB063]